MGTVVVCLALAACGTLLGTTEDSDSPSPAPDNDGASVGSGDDTTDAAGEDAHGDVLTSPWKDAGKDADADAGDPNLIVGPFLVFVSSKQYASNALGDADAKCQTLATNAGLSGTFAAWVSYSDARGDAKSRVTGAGPWKNKNKQTLFDNRVDLLTHKVQSNVPWLDETGASYTDQNPWTGTASDGTLGASHCSNWASAAGTGITGGIGQIDGRWTDEVADSCAKSHTIYCFEHP